MTQPETHVLVVPGGELGGLTAERLPRHSYVVAADSGVLWASTLGLSVDIAVGDFDSLPAAVLASTRERGVEIRPFPTAKNATDLEIALDTALELGANRITIVGGAGGRLDHLIGNVTLMANDKYGRCTMTAMMGAATVTVVRRRSQLAGTPRELVSLFAVNGDAHGVSTEGLLYLLQNETLEAASSRGVSNEFVATTATVDVKEGVLVAIQPGETSALA